MTVGMKASQVAHAIPSDVVDRVTLVLPWPPSVNHYWMSRVGGPRNKPIVMRYIGPKGTEFRERSAAAIIAQGSPRIEGRLAVMIAVHAPTLAKRDLDNLGKAALDALTACGVIEDDSYIDLLRFRRRAVRPGGELVVRIRRIDPQGEMF